VAPNLGLLTQWQGPFPSPNGKNLPPLASVPGPAPFIVYDLGLALNPFTNAVCGTPKHGFPTHTILVVLQSQLLYRDAGRWPLF
jgi:hypothetical protein